MALIRLLVIIAISISVYFALQYVAHPDDFQTPTDMIEELRQSEERDIHLTIQNQALSQPTITLSKGDSASIFFKSLDQNYQVKVEQLGFFMNVLPDEENVMRFIADIEGEYVIECVQPCKGEVLGTIVVQ